MMSVLVPLLLFFSITSSTNSQVLIHYTSYGGICRDTCGYHGYGYTWCKQIGGSKKEWDYCSLKEGLEASGKSCATSCDLWGGSYRYCHLKDGGWHYCGLIGRKDFLQYSQGNQMCVNSCRADNGDFQCDTGQGTQRCSPFHDVTPTGLPCHSNYRCAKLGHDVYQCQTDDDEKNWDYCGRKSLNMCVWFYSETNSTLAEICTLPITQAEGKIMFRRERRDRMLPPTKKEFKHAVHLINKITSTTSLPDAGHLATMHLYKQDVIFCKGINYTNVELNVGLETEAAVPIAHVIFPESLNSAEILRLAFYTSLHSTFYQPAYTIAVSVNEPMLCSTDHQ